MERKRGRVRPEEIEDLGIIELPKEEDTKIRQMIAEADAEILEHRVSIRWPQDSLYIIKRVAVAMGVPYQTYIKQVAYRAALDDMARIQATIAGMSKETSVVREDTPSYLHPPSPKTD